MKTSQQIAEEMAAKIHPIWAMEDEDRTFDEIILAEIPLVQLIEVARAANANVKAVTHAEQCNAYDMLVDAVIALKQTGKAEWL